MRRLWAGVQRPSDRHSSAVEFDDGLLPEPDFENSAVWAEDSAQHEHHSWSRAIDGSESDGSKSLDTDWLCDITPSSLPSEARSEASSTVSSSFTMGTFSEAGLGVRQVVPRRFQLWFGMALCVLTLAIVFRFMQKAHRTNGYTHSLPIAGIVAFMLLGNLALRISGLLREHWFVAHEELLTLWSCMLSGLLAAVVCGSSGLDQTACEGIRHAGATPRVQILEIVSVLWSLASQFPRWCVFEKRPQTRRQVLAAVALAACILVAPVPTYMLHSTSCLHDQGKATIWFSLGCLAAAQIFSGELVRFLSVGDGTGFRVVIWPALMGLYCLSASVVQNDKHWGALCWACLALLACAIVCGSVATHVPEDICSTSPLYDRELYDRVLYDRKRALATNCLSRGIRSVKRYAITWRGTFMLCAANSLVSIWVYRPWVKRTYHDCYRTMTEEQRHNAIKPLRIGSATRSIHIILILAMLSFCVSLFSVWSDRCKQHSTEQASALPDLPRDRHFRCITALKAGMIVVKTDFLMSYADPKAFGEQTIMQAVSIAATVACVNWGVIKMFKAAQGISHEFVLMFRRPVTMWRAAIMCILLWNSMCGILLLCVVFNAIGTERVIGVDPPSPQELSWLGVVLPLGTKWLYVGNELTLVLSSKLSEPKVFAAVQSRQGVGVLVTAGAVGTPMTMVLKATIWLYYCENRKLGLQDGVDWHVWVCFAVTMTFIGGGIAAYVALGSHG